MLLLKRKLGGKGRDSIVKREWWFKKWEIAPEKEGYVEGIRGGHKAEHLIALVFFFNKQAVSLSLHSTIYKSVVELGLA